MVYRTTAAGDHVLTLRPGASGEIPFRATPGKMAVHLVTADSTTRRIELSLDNLWGGYEMMKFVEKPEGEEWAILRVSPDGRVHALLDLEAGERVYIVSEGHRLHNIELKDVDWQGNEVVLTFQETP